MQFDAFFAFLQSSTLATLLDGSRYISMTIQIIHILGFTFLLALALAFNLRVLRLALRELPLQQLAVTLHRPFLIALGIAVLAGILLFLPRAVTYAGNTPFVWKMGLLVAASVMQLVVFRQATALSVDHVNDATPVAYSGITAVVTRLPTLAFCSTEAAVTLRAAALLAVLLWLAIGVAGRAIGFV